MKYLKSIFVFAAVISFFIFTPKIFAAVNSFTINNYQGGGGTVSVFQQVIPTLLSPGSTIDIDGSISWGGGAQGSSTMASMKASMYPTYSDEIIVAPTSLSSVYIRTNGNKSFTAPSTPGNYVFILETTAFGQTESHNFPFTVAQPPVVNVTASPVDIAYGALSVVSWTSSNSVSCTSSSGGGTGTSGSFYTPNLYSDTLYTVFCTNSVGDTKSGSVYINVSGPTTPSATLIATPPSIISGGSSVLSWTSVNVNWCDLHLNNINGPILASGINNPSFNVGPLSANTTYLLHCQKNGSTISSSCTGVYQTSTQTCVGQLGGNTCGFPDSGSGSECGQFSASECYVSSDPWCHHACHVSTTTATNSCNGLSESQCDSNAGCTFNPGLVIPPTVVDRSVTVTVNATPVLPTVDIVSASNGSQGPLSVENNTNTELRVNTSNIVSCVIKKDTVYFGNFNQSPQYTFLTGNLSTRVNPYIFEVTCTGNQSTSATDSISILVTESPTLNFADLTTGIVSYSPSTIANGTPITFTATVTNEGTSSTVVPFRNFLQIMEVEEGGRQNLTDLSPTLPALMGPLVPGATSTVSKTHTFTSLDATSNYSARFCADKLNRNDSGLVNEGENENNNCGGWVPFNGGTPQLPDLTTGVTTPALAVVGVPVNFKAIVSNLGPVSTGTSFQGSLQVTNENPAATSINPPGNFPIPNISVLPPGGLAQVTKNHTFTAQDTYYVRICADMNSSTGSGSIVESNENNNCGPWTTVTVSPNLPDLIADPITPTSALVNLKVNLSSKIKNQGSASTGHSFYNFFQLANSNPDVNPATPVNNLPQSNMATLIAGGSRQAVLGYTFTSDGTYYVRACADKKNPADAGTVNEGVNENNNCSTWTAVVVGGLPDLVADPITPNSAPVNVNVDLSSKITNQGTSSTRHSFSNFFQVINEDPIAALNPPQDLFSSNMGTLEAGESGFTVSRYKFTSAGTYYVRACADKKNSADAGTVDEGIRENNNCSDWSPVVVGGLPDLISSDITPFTAVANTPVNLTSTITNRGTASTEHHFYNFFQITSDDPSLATPPTILNELDYTMRTLLAGESAEAFRVHTFPSSGTYYIRVCADKKDSADSGSVYENNENNNCSSNWASVTVGLTNDKPDLIASLISPTSGLVNTEITLSSTIKNQGGASTGASFNNFIQIATLPDGAGSITERPSNVMLTLTPGAHSDTITKYTFPTTGVYSVRACADKASIADSGTINEGLNETNNCGPHWTNVRITTKKVNASCAPSHYSCIPSTIIGTNGVADTANLRWTWDCEGLSGGNSSSCSEPMPNLGGAVACGIEKYTCAPGDPITLLETGTHYNWKCVSRDRLNSVLCTKLKDEGGGVDTCFDGIQNQNETGVDCGGVCPRCNILPKYKEN